MSNSKRPRLRALSGAAALLASTAAYAADVPADGAGAKTIADFLTAYVGQAALPTFKITQEGSGYGVSFDLASASAGLKSAGVTYDPAEVKFRVFQQSDGAWRVEMAELPLIKGHMTAPQAQGGDKIDIEINAPHMTSRYLIDPKLNWIDALSGGGDKLSVVEHGPGLEEFVEFGQLKFDGKTTSGASGLVSTLQQPAATIDLVMDIDPKGVDPNTKGPAKPVHVSAKGAGLTATIALKDFQPAPLLDAWKFAVAHPERADYARDFDALKGIVTAVIADRLTLDEQVALDKLSFNTVAGPVVLEGAGGAVNIVSNGAESGFGEHVSTRALKLPDGMIPPIYAAMTPTSFDIAFNAMGFDIASAAQEWFADAKLDGDDPVLSPADRAKVSAKLTQSRPIVVDILPSHIAAPSLDIAFEGKVTIDKGKPYGTVTIKLRDFDKTAEAVQALGPEASQKLVPVIAMAKGLGKAGPDGTMTWVGELGKDKVMKVNGLPLGKAPM